jgi:hypothetical protein
MQYTTRLGDKPTEAHVNYKCPCGCTAGLIYDRESGSTELGQCCCGRLLWVGDDGEARVRASFDSQVEYTLARDRITLPWGEEAWTVLAVPREQSHD